MLRIWGFLLQYFGQSIDVIIVKEAQCKTMSFGDQPPYGEVNITLIE